MSSFFSSDGSFTLQFIIIFVVIFLMLAAGVFLMRRFTGQGPSLTNKTAARGRQPRLGIVDIYELDRQRQLILLRRDNVEHLLLVGGPNDVVVERNITRGINARLATDETSYDDPPEPVPEPAAPVAYQPEPPVQTPPAMTYREPSFAMPVVVPAPVPGSQAPPPAMARPLDLPPRFDTVDAVRPVEPDAQPRRKESQLARVIRRAPPSLVNLVPAALVDRMRLPERAPDPIPEPAPARMPDAPAPVVAPPAARAIDAAILSDMARQLEEALRRPAAAVRPAAPAQPEPAQPEPAHPATAPESELVPPVEAPFVAPPAPQAEAVDPMAAAMAATAEPPAPVAPLEDHALFHDAVEPAPEPLPPEPPKTEAVPPQAEPQPEPEPVADAPAPEEPVVHAIVADAPQIDPQHAEPHPVEAPAPVPAESEAPPFVAPEPHLFEPAAVEPPAPEPQPAPKPPASPNPFSVEEIEAEFARLLGRPLDRKP